MNLPCLPFYMIRHGETIANQKDIAAGAVDTPLTEHGIHQALDAQKNLSKLPVPPTAIFHSPLSRARDTARILNEPLNLPLFEEPLIAERSFGRWAGEPLPAVLDQIRQGVTPPEGESTTAFYTRALKGMEKILHTSQPPVLIVTHGGVFDAFFDSHSQHLPEMTVENGVLYAFSPTSGPFPWRWERI